MVNDPAIRVSISIKESKRNQILSHVKKHNYRSEAALWDEIINYFFNKDKKGVLKNFMVFMGYPLLIVGLMLYVSLTTQNANEILIKQGYYFNELYLANQVFYIIGFAFLGLTMPLTYLFFYKMKKKE